ncbi:MAG: hypothetical protein ABL930_07180 [Pseudobdellovibrio sp.]
MTKLISFVVFIAAFVSTWFLFNSESKISLATHAGIQSKFITLIEETVKAAKPNSSNFEILNIYTEKIDDNQIGAHFSYKYTDQLEDKEKVNQVMSGVAVLYRGLSENPQDDKWIVKSIKTDQATLEFQQGIVVNSEASVAASSDITDPVKVEEKKNE